MEAQQKPLRRRTNSHQQKQEQEEAEAHGSQQPTSSFASSQTQRAPNKRSSAMEALNWAALLLAFMNASWLAYHYQVERLPPSLSALQAGRSGFSEQRAFRHVKGLTSLGPHPLGSDALDLAIEYVLAEAEKVAKAANPNVDVEVELFHAEPGVNTISFKGRSLAYTKLKHVVVRVVPRLSENAEASSVLVSSHIDTVITSEGAGDCSSCIGVMLELVRALSHSAQHFKHSIIFLFNIGEEEGLDGAHSFITQHPLNSTIRACIDLEAIGAGGRSQLFQAGPDRWLLNKFAQVAKYPSGLVAAQDVFLSGSVKSATDFQVYREFGGLSGLDFAYMGNLEVYHTKNDRLELVRSGSLQHSGDNMLALLQEVASLPELPDVKLRGLSSNAKMDSVFFDIMGRYLVVYTKQFAQQLNLSILLQSFILLIGSLFKSRQPALVPLTLALVTIALMWSLSIAMAAFAGFIISVLLNSQFPFVSFPWLTIGLFGAPSLFGALLGHSVGHSILLKYMQQACLSKPEKVDPKNISDFVIWDVEKLLFKAGFLQWIFILALGTWFNVGASYIALFWLVAPAVAYGVKEIFLFPRQPEGGLKTYVLFFGLPLPIIFSAETFFLIPYLCICNLLRFDRHPGGTPLWVGNVALAIIISVIVCMSFVYLFPYVHRSGGIRWILLGTALVSMVTFCVACFEVLPAYTNEVSRAMNVTHVVETTGSGREIEGAGRFIPKSYISVSSFTPGTLVREMQFLHAEGFICESNEGPDFVTFNVKYGCRKEVVMEESIWIARPTFNVTRDIRMDEQRITSVLMKTASARRWALSVNTNKVKALELEIITGDSGSKQTLIPKEDIVGEEGWHIVQYASHKNSPTEFVLNLFWYEDATADDLSKKKNPETAILKLRTDLPLKTAELSRVLPKLPAWCTSFGKSTSPYALAYLANIWLDESSDSFIF